MTCARTPEAPARWLAGNRSGVAEEKEAIQRKSRIRGVCVHACETRFYQFLTGIQRSGLGCIILHFSFASVVLRQNASTLRPFERITHSTSARITYLPTPTPIVAELSLYTDRIQAFPPVENRSLRPTKSYLPAEHRGTA